MDRDPGWLIDDKHHPVAIKKTGEQVLLPSSLLTRYEAAALYNQPRHLNQKIGISALTMMTNSANS